MNPVPETENWRISTLELPVLVSVTVSAWLVPRVTPPKDSPVGVSESSPAPRLVPDPLREMVAAAFEASLVTVAVALNAPVVLGAKVMLIDVLCPAARVTGRLGEVSRKS